MANVVDANTIAIDDQVLKIFGIITPGPRQKCRAGSLPWLCGAAARDYLGKIAHGRKVSCKKKENGFAICAVNGKDIGLLMVTAGWAVADEQGTAYMEAERSAKVRKAGIWGNGGSGS